MNKCSLKCQDEDLMKQDLDAEISWKWLFDENADEQADEYDQFNENVDDPVTTPDEEVVGMAIFITTLIVYFCI